METINNSIDSVKKTIWGEGNGGGIASSISNPGGTSETHKSMIDDTVTETKYSGRTEKDPMAPDSYDPDKREIEKSADGSNITGQEEGQNKNSMSNSNEPNTGFGGAGAEPSVGADPSSGQQDTTKQQGANRPNEEPESTGSSDSAASGPPGGGSMGGMGGGMKLPDDGKESHSEGTGQKYEKSTGLHADGGDFDATRPGAAREADRLMDEKGIKHGDENPGGSSGQEDKKEKKWYGVDHSGFGGHGSHSNKRPSASEASTKEPNIDGDNKTTSVNDYDGDDGAKKTGLVSKIKDKLHSSSSD